MSGLYFLRDVLSGSGFSFAQEEEDQSCDESKAGEASNYASCDWACL